MGKVSKSPQVFLSGGLGNQLFQLAAALAKSSGIVVLNGSLGHPRTNLEGKPDIMAFALPSRVHVAFANRYPTIIKFSSDLLIRASSSSKLKPGNVKRRMLTKFVGLVFSLFFRELRRISLSHGTGFFEVNKLDTSCVLFGFFHTHVFPSRLKGSVDDLSKIQLINPSRKLVSLVENIGQKRILILHIRLGDYHDEPELGILPPEYFQTALRAAHLGSNFDEIWLFSASPQIALSYVPEVYRDKVIVMEGLVSSPAETLELMRYGDSYVISNSTFGWWAAFLSYKSRAKVYAPEPWFAFAEEPYELCPEDWLRVRW